MTRRKRQNVPKATLHGNCHSSAPITATQVPKLPSELDGVGPVDNRPSTDKLHHFVRKKKKKKGHVTCDTWHVTRDTLGGVNILLKFQLPSSYRFIFYRTVFTDLWYYEDLEEKDELIN